VGLLWYAVALLTAPLLETAILYALSLTSKAFLPTMITVDDKASLLVGGLVVGLLVPFFEEIGWTGFATPELRKRHGVLATGLIVGLLWGVWHVPFFAQTASGPVPPALNAAAIVFFWLLPYRVLMVWVYDHTQSVPMAMLMHVSLTVYTFVVPGSPAIAGVPRADLYPRLRCDAVGRRGRGRGGQPQKAPARGTHACHSTHTRWVIRDER
jgi:membrane protease YdiL (CAAX protease family)